MHKKYTIVGDKTVVVDEDYTITLYDNSESIGEIINLENDIQVKKIKEDELEYNLKTMEEEYQNHKFGTYSFSRFLFKLNLIMITSLILVGFYTNTYSFVSFLLPMEVVMVFSIDYFNNLTKKQYKVAHRKLKAEIENNYNEIDKLEKKLSNLKKDINIEKITTNDTNISYLKSIRDSYIKTYGLCDEKVFKLK